LFGQVGKNKGAGGPSGHLEYYLIVTHCSVLVFAFTAWDVAKEVVDFVAEGLGGDNMLALEGGHACKYFKVCKDVLCGVGTK
jgi:hypothetical protein